MFISYAHKDRELKDELIKHLIDLQRQGLITPWLDVEIVAGTVWEQQIIQHLHSAHLILLLISVDFMASEFCYSVEMKQAMKRHMDNEARVIPILLRPTDWHKAPFSKLQMLPTDAKPVVKWPTYDDAFTDVAKGIRKAIEEMKAIEATPPGATPPGTSHTSAFPIPISGFLRFILIGCFILLLILISFQGYNFFGKNQNGDASSNLIPLNSTPIIDDPLSDNSKGNQWDVVPNVVTHNQSRSCVFQGGAYHLKASVKYGINCITNAPSTNFINFVYQIKMIFSQGFDDLSSGAGPSFGVDPQHNNALYKVSFNRQYQWSVWTPENPNLYYKKGTSSFINVGSNQPNYITIKVLNSQIDIQINGHPLISFTDPNYRGGYLGVTEYSGASIGDVAFSDAKVWLLN